MNTKPVKAYESIYSIQLANTGTHETFVIMMDGVPHSVRSWNYIEDDKGNRVFNLENNTTWQLGFRAGSTVQVIR